MNTSPWTAPKIKALKGKEKIVCLTAYDYAMARLVDAAGIHLVLVGDSLGMTMLGYENTLPVTMDDMIHHTAAVARGVKTALVVGDMPFLSYHASIEQAILNAGRFIQEGGANAVKIEGGAFREPLIHALVQNGIPVLGHIGLTPQSIEVMGGYKVQGRNHEGAKQLLEDARAVEEAGAFALVLEAMPSDLAAEITATVKIPTIGIGAGPACDGQVLVLHDVLGLYGDFKPKFVKRYADLGAQVAQALAQYRQEVQSGAFPGPEQSYE
ncbi:MAG TPA: 3-methyl-2-oxobutanoate hydroxymethyltransferase [Kiritimatiellia bacterium]|nr:3-methyl-2-oxobutanoate hydroxymethyltransferase [Kiritimatiellia bacterium]HRZ12356.1 3-methyl-2-oxobutanoate hydroxymethyltransferase [Kiritimatiellia bacterium]HSA17886.1 3-methyl-2-oxobutanoate hydroxymethyltransferase [Kiritimatiellia bacterium]